MGYLSKSAVEAGIKVRVRKDRFGREHTDYEAYFGTDPFSKCAVRKTRSSRDELLKDIREFFLRHSRGGDALVILTPIQAIDAKKALDALASAGLSISLSEAVCAYLGGAARVSGANTDVDVVTAYREYLKGKETSEADRNKVEATVGRWAKDYGETKKLSSVTAGAVQDYLKANFIVKVKKDKRTGKKTEKKLKPKTYNSHLLYLNTFFNWCAKDERLYLQKNPIKSLEYRPDPWEEPEYLKASDAEKIMRLLESRKESRPDMLAYEIVNLFCGARDAEVLRMAEDDSANKINIEDETVRIAKGKGFQLGRRPRAFHIPETALAWMKSFDFMSAVKRITKDTKIDLYKFVRANGVKVFQNYGRHTFITYHVAAYGDPAKTQAIVGTSEKMRAENYCGLASKADGEAFFAIMPSSAQSKLDDLAY